MVDLGLLRPRNRNPRNYLPVATAPGSDNAEVRFAGRYRNRF